MSPGPRLCLAVVVAAVAAGSSGCGGTGCKPVPHPALRVIVLDGPGGAAICDATVTATDGAYMDALTPGTSGTGFCIHSGATERPGVYTIVASFEGRTATTPNVRVDTGDCGAKAREVEMVLPAAPAPVAERPAEP